MRDIHIVVACPAAAQPSKGIVLPEARSIRRVSAVTWEIAVKAEE